MFKVLFGCLIVSMVLFSSAAHAAVIVLHSGQKITGDVIEQTELRLTVDINGTPTTYYLGEIASIDGKAVEMPQEKAVETALEEAKKGPGDEQSHLAKIMVKRNVDTAPAVAPAPSAVSPTPSQAALLVSGGNNKSVVSTTDGGIIVVSSDKITKFDKDLNVVKEVDLSGAAPIAVPPPAVPTPAPPVPVAAPQAQAPAPAVPSPDRSTPQTLKDFLGNIFSGSKK